MEKYILDTCTWIEYFHYRYGVRDYVEKLSPNQLCASEVTIAELTYGAINSSDYERHIKEPQRLLHRLNHRLDEGDFLICQAVLCVKVSVSPRTGEVLEVYEARLLNL